MSEQPRPAANTDEHSFLLSVEEAADRYAAAGHPRTIRAIQKYCGRGDLECQKVETTYGERYLITPASVDRHIAMIKERTAANGHEQPRFGVPVSVSTQAANGGEPAANVREQPRPAANGDEQPRTDPDVARLASENQLLRSENEFLRGQVAVKDEQIKDQMERARETNVLIGGLQKMLTPLLGRPEGGPQVHQPYNGDNPQ